MTLRIFTISILMASAFSSCKKDSTTPTILTEASVRTDSVGSIDKTSAKIYGTIVAEGKTAVIGAGIAWATHANPSVYDSILPSRGFGIGSFNLLLSRLTPNVKYFTRAYATNASGTTYGNEQIFTTIGNNAISFCEINPDSITSNSAVVGVTIDDDPTNMEVTARGICWSSTNDQPTLADNHISSDAGFGSFSVRMTGLTPGTRYYVRSYTTNRLGTTYGYSNGWLGGSFFTRNLPSQPGPPLTDMDGNIYNTIQIGSQLWMAENLKVSRYTDGSAIPTGLSNSEWNNASEGAYCIYNNNSTNNETYGKLYNFYAVVDGRNLCPSGWHVPSEVEWTTLENYLGGANVAGGKLKSMTSLWYYNTGSNESGFSGLPGGLRDLYDEYNNMGNSGNWWASSTGPSNYAPGRNLQSDNTIYYPYYQKKMGISVRCIKN
jgi:uncharacterized protein (TIGR02145 family)